MLVRRSRLALISSALLVGVVLGCTSGGTGATPSPTATPTGSPTPTASPSPTATTRAPFVLGSPTPVATVDLARSRAVVDEVIAAVEAKDVDALEGLVLEQQVPCSGKAGGGPEGPPFPGCGGLPAETPVPAFPAAVCSGVWHADPRPMLERFVARADALYAVIEGPGVIAESAGIAPVPIRWDYRVIFVAEPTGTPLAYQAVVGEGQLVSLVLGCTSPSGANPPSDESPPRVVERGPSYVEPTPFPTAAPTTPPGDAADVSRGTRTGDEAIDAAIRALESHDPAAIRSVIGLMTEQCTWAFGLSARCDEGMLEGALVSTFWSGHCDAGTGIADADALAREFASLDLVLYAVSGQSDGRGVLVYEAGPSAISGRFFLVQDGAITGEGTYGCTSPAEVAQWFPLLLRGPAWPEDSE